MELELVMKRASDLKNVNWRNGELRAYGVAWLDSDPQRKVSTDVDAEGNTEPVWNQLLRLRLPDAAGASTAPTDAELRIDVVQDRPAQNTKPLIGTARLPLAQIFDADAGDFGSRVDRTLNLKRPSGRPQGKLHVAVTVSVLAPYTPPGASAAGLYGYPRPGAGGGYGYAERSSYPHGSYGSPSYPVEPPPVGGGYANPSAAAYRSPPPAGYGYGNPPPPRSGYDNPTPGSGYGYGNPAAAAAAASGYPYQGTGQPPAYGTENVSTKKSGSSSKYGMGTGLAVGAVAGVMGGLALGEAAHYAEDKFDEKVDERVQQDDDEQQQHHFLAAADDDDYGGGGGGGGDDW